jgi:hypothetical protein
MHFPLLQRLLWGSFILLFLITIRLSILVYQVSPLRKPIFNPYDAPWLTDGSENKILLAAMILALMWAVNLTLLIASIIPSNKPYIINYMLVVLISASISPMFFLLFYAYLFSQWAVD